jgi:glycosidase
LTLQRQQSGLLGWLDGLNDFRTETPYVRSNMAAIYEYWIQQIGFDGFRVDTALEVDMGCWQIFLPGDSFLRGDQWQHQLFHVRRG